MLPLPQLVCLCDCWFRQCAAHISAHVLLLAQSSQLTSPQSVDKKHFAFIALRNGDYNLIQSAANGGYASQHCSTDFSHLFTFLRRLEFLILQGLLSCILSTQHNSKISDDPLWTRIILNILIQIKQTVNTMLMLTINDVVWDRLCFASLIIRSIYAEFSTCVSSLGSLSRPRLSYTFTWSGERRVLLFKFNLKN